MLFVGRGALRRAARAHRRCTPRRFGRRDPEATILFADIVGFTQLTQRTDPVALVALLDDVFSAFDDEADRLGLEKIKTIGDAYMVAAGVPVSRPDHVEAAARMALAMLQVPARFARKRGIELSLRIGIHRGL